jgi:hypothetical protein
MEFRSGQLSDQLSGEPDASFAAHTWKVNRDDASVMVKQNKQRTDVDAWQHVRTVRKKREALPRQAELRWRAESSGAAEQAL